MRNWEGLELSWKFVWSRETGKEKNKERGRNREV